MAIAEIGLKQKNVNNIENNLQTFYNIQWLYNIPIYNTNLDITWSCWSFFYNGILQWNCKKMTINGYFLVISL